MTEHNIELSRLRTLGTALLVVMHENDLLKLTGEAGHVPSAVRFQASQARALSLPVTVFEDGRWMLLAMGWELLGGSPVSEWSVTLEFAPTYEASLIAGCYRSAQAPSTAEIAGRILIVSKRRSRLVHGMMAPGVVLALAIVFALTTGHALFSQGMRVALVAAIPPLVGVMLSWRDRRRSCWWHWGSWFAALTSVLSFVWTAALLRDAHYVRNDAHDVRNGVAATASEHAPTTVPEVAFDHEIPDENQPIVTMGMASAPREVATRSARFTTAWPLPLDVVCDRYSAIFAHPWTPMVPWFQAVLGFVQPEALRAPLCAKNAVDVPQFARRVATFRCSRCQREDRNDSTHRFAVFSE